MWIRFEIRGTNPPLSDGHLNTQIATIYIPTLTTFQPIDSPAILPTMPAAAPSAQPPVLLCSQAAGRTSGALSPFRPTARHVWV